MSIFGIRERMEVHAGDRLVGVVDRIEDDGIKLRRGGSSDGRHHTIPMAWVLGIEGGRVMLDRDADSVMAGWGDDSLVGVDAMLEDTMGSAGSSDTMGSADSSMGGGSAPSMGGDDMGGSSMGGNDIGSGFESASTSSGDDDDDDEDEQDGNIPRM